MDNITIKFEIVTPERVVLKEEIKQVTVPTKEGEITVMPGHIPLVASLRAGVIEIIKKNGQKEIMSVSGGFIEVLCNKIVILADRSERAEELDEVRAEEARTRAEKIMKEERLDHEQIAEVSALIAKEIARGKAVKRWKKLKNINQS